MSTATSGKSFTISFVKYSKRMLDNDDIKKQLEKIANAAMRNEQRGWQAKFRTDYQPEEVEYEGSSFLRYVGDIRLTKERYRNENVLQEQFQEVVKICQQAANAHQWQLIKEDEEDGEPNIPDKMKGKRLKDQDLDFELPPLSDSVMREHFGHVYERDSHIRTIYASARTAAMTKFNKRRHVLLKGRPACAKTEVFLGFERWWTDKWVLRLDATTLTKAGLETELIRMAQDDSLPPFVLIEEIEKADPKNFPCLLSVMDQRGRVQRTNARVGNIVAETKIVVWATCNSVKLLKQFQGGALYSRFNHKLHCARPSPDLMKRILFREADEMGLKKTMAHDIIPRICKFIYDVRKNDDPRDAISLLDYGDEWLQGVPKDLDSIMKAQKEERDREKELDLSYDESGDE